MGAVQSLHSFFGAHASSGERHILNHLSKLLDSQSMADVLFIVKGQKIGAHSAIVVSASPVMAAMFEPDKFKEGRGTLIDSSEHGYQRVDGMLSNTKVVDIDDIDPDVFHQMLRYVYTGHVTDLHKDSMAEELYLAADKYQIDSLKDLCEESMTWNMNIHNVIAILVLAYVHTSPKLLDKALEFLVKNKKEIWKRPEWKQLMERCPDLFFIAAHRMIN